MRHARSAKLSTAVSFGHNLIGFVPRAIVALGVPALEQAQRMIVCVLGSIRVCGDVSHRSRDESANRRGKPVVDPSGWSARETGE
jgi:uncharacterized membrane protein YecN with MAPEG domain